MQHARPRIVRLDQLSKPKIGFDAWFGLRQKLLTQATKQRRVDLHGQARELSQAQRVLTVTLLEASEAAIAQAALAHPRLPSRAERLTALALVRSLQCTKRTRSLRATGQREGAKGVSPIS